MKKPITTVLQAAWLCNLPTIGHGRYMPHPPCGIRRLHPGGWQRAVFQTLPPARTTPLVPRMPLDSRFCISFDVFKSLAAIVLICGGEPCLSQGFFTS